jgi:hypothetical protein
MFSKVSIFATLALAGSALAQLTISTPVSTFILSSLVQQSFWAMNSSPDVCEYQVMACSFYRLSPLSTRVAWIDADDR